MKSFNNFIQERLNLNSFMINERLTLDSFMINERLTLNKDSKIAVKEKEINFGLSDLVLFMNEDKDNPFHSYIVSNVLKSYKAGKWYRTVPDYSDRYEYYFIIEEMDKMRFGKKVSKLVCVKLYPASNWYNDSMNICYGSIIDGSYFDFETSMDILSHGFKVNNTKFIYNFYKMLKDMQNVSMKGQPTFIKDIFKKFCKDNEKYISKTRR